MKTKIFDCVEMKRQGAELIQSKLEGKTLDEQLEFWRSRTDELLERQKKYSKTSAQQSTKT